MSTTVTEGRYSAEFLISEAEGTRSRETGTIAASQTLVAGSVLGKKTVGAATAGSVTGTGTGTISAVTTTSLAMPGAYVLTCIHAEANKGSFSVKAPDGTFLSTLYVAVAYLDQIGLTVGDATDWVVGDTFTVTVAAGSGQYVVCDPSLTNGGAIACAIARDALASTSATPEMCVFVRDCEVKDTSLDFGSMDAGQIATATAQLAKVGIIVREVIG